MATTLSSVLSERERERGREERQIRRERKTDVKCLLQAVAVGCIPAEVWP